MPTSGQEVALATRQDIRSLYDELVPEKAIDVHVCHQPSRQEEGILARSLTSRFTPIQRDGQSGDGKTLQTSHLTS